MWVFDGTLTVSLRLESMFQDTKFSCTLNVFLDSITKSRIFFRPPSAGNGTQGLEHLTLCSTTESQAQIRRKPSS